MKLPSMQFYPGDWMKDPAIRSLSMAAKGLWIDMLCLMHESDRRGYLQHATGKPVTAEQLARMTGCSTDDVSRLLQELKDSGVFSCTEHGVIYSRRIVRDEAKRQKCSDAGKRGGGNPALAFKGDTKGDVKGDVKGVPKASSSSSSSPSGKEPPISPVPGDCDGEPAKADDPPKPEAVPEIPAGMLYHTPGEQERRKQAKAIITDLNARCGKAFPDTGGILSVILERLREGRHPPEFEKIITNKLADPHFQANPSLYTPNTLFRKTHFDQYLTEKPSDYTTGGKHGGRDYQSGRKRHIAERPIEEQAKPHGEEAF